MALQFIAEGARRGERALMITLDEPPAQVLRNAHSIGIDLQSAIDKGLVHLWYEPPQEIEIDRHFAQMETLVEHFKPQRAVIDSLSTYGSRSEERRVGKEWRPGSGAEGAKQKVVM